MHAKHFGPNTSGGVWPHNRLDRNLVDGLGTPPSGPGGLVEWRAMHMGDLRGPEESTDSDSAGVSRREALRRGGSILGGAALVWATPVVHTVGISRAMAASTSPAESDISFIAMNVVCGGTKYVIKWEDNDTTSGSWDDEPGKFPDCTASDFTPDGEKTDGGALGFNAAVQSDGSVRIDVPSGCSVTSSATKSGSGTSTSDPCCPGPTGSGSLTFTACD